MQYKGYTITKDSPNSNNYKIYLGALLIQTGLSGIEEAKESIDSFSE